MCPRIAAGVLAVTKAPVTEPQVRTVSGLEAVSLGLLLGGCRLAFAGTEAVERCPRQVWRFSRRLGRLGGALVEADSDRTAALLAAGAALTGGRAVALVFDLSAALSGLHGLEDLAPVLVDLSGGLPLHQGDVRLLWTPHTPDAAFDAGRAVWGEAAAARCPGVIAGLAGVTGRLAWPKAPDEGPPLPFAHAGPDDPDLLLLSAGPGYAACAEARAALDADGLDCAHLHLCRVAPFPAAIVAPVITSARRVLVVEPGGRGTLSGHIRQHLGAPVHPFHSLHRPGDALEIARRAREVAAR